MADQTTSDGVLRRIWPHASRSSGLLFAGGALLLLASCRNFSVPSGSNIPTLLVGDVVMVLPFGEGPLVGAPARGDMAVFRLPKDRSTYFIKRVIGLPGDRIRMRDGRLFINGSRVPREPAGSYKAEMAFSVDKQVPKYRETLSNGRNYEVIEVSEDIGFYDNTDEYVVPAGHYFTMGDNRDNSDDSRDLAGVGYIPLENFVGKPWRVLFSTAKGQMRLFKIVQ
ncbi:signal peptidase I [Labrys sp. KB_33_2]|uniref:signal peptidase I n=1 Tax=Labrys sp. KB_33_2 TaxID=3237479 RepID=UPI003F920AE2